MSNDANVTVTSQVSLESLKLRPGTMMQVRQDVNGAPICEVQLLGVIRGKSVMVGFKADSRSKATLHEGKNYLLRGFSGQEDFSFTAQAQQVFKSPVAYATLVYPAMVDVKVIRKAMRSKVSLRAKASLQGKNIPHEVTLIDVSIAGAKIDSLARIGPPGELINLTFAVEIEKNKVDLDLLSTIRYTTQSERGEGYSIGVEFHELSRDNQLVLHYLATQARDAGNNDIVL